jgi:hypothetical protein
MTDDFTSPFRRERQADERREQQDRQLRERRAQLGWFILKRLFPHFNSETLQAVFFARNSDFHDTATTLDCAMNILPISGQAKPLTLYLLVIVDRGRPFYFQTLVHIRLPTTPFKDILLEYYRLT